MAFNPFHSFRKHQKVFFAGLTIMCMFVFVLQFGTGDFFQRSSGWFGGGKADGPVVATLYGKEVRQKQLTDLHDQRMAARALVYQLMRMAFMNITDSTRVDKSDLELTDVLQHLKSPQSQASNKDLINDQFIIQKRLQDLTGKDGKEEDRKFLEQIAWAMKVQPKLMTFEAGDFGPLQGEGDLLDFMIWKNQADMLKIVLTDNVVRQILKGETGGLDMFPEGAFKSNKDIQGMLRMMPEVFKNLTETQLLAAVGDEFRVIMAQEALLGGPLYFQESRVSQGPEVVTPSQYLQYFREQRTTVKAALLPLSVAGFEKSITETPSQADLTAIYDKYKDKVPDPISPTPGFKEPRKFRVEAVSGDADSDYYKLAGRERLLLNIVNETIGGAGVYQGGGGPGAGALQAIFPVMNDPLLEEAQFYTRQMNMYSNYGLLAGPQLTNRSYYAAATLGQVLAGVTSGNLGYAPSAIQSTQLADQATRTRLAGVAVLGGSAPGLPQAVMTLPYMTPPNQPEQVADRLMTIAESAMGKQVLRTDLGMVKEKLDKLKNKPAEAKSFLETDLKKTGLELSAMKEPRDSFQLATDPALKKMLEAWVKEGMKDELEKPKPEALEKEFAQHLALSQVGPYQVIEWSPEGGTVGLGSAVRKMARRFPQLLNQLTRENVRMFEEQSWHASKEPYLFWHAEVLPEKTRTFNSAKPDVIKAWEHMRARQLALKKAQDIGAAVQEHQWPSDSDARTREIEAFLNTYSNDGKAFVLDNIARQVKQFSTVAGVDSFQKYEVPEDKIKYPPANFLDLVLGLQKPGESTYMKDRPENTVYVIVLLARSEPTFDEFKKLYTAFTMDPLLTSLVDERRREFRTKFMENLREQASPEQAPKGAWKSEIAKKTFGQRGSSQEDE